ncbi:MAG: M15 family metallopeptidase [Brevundimonas sp.]|uniref:M15 family metallopeptidase n=1 Tax=Brevundimonas sp. TaxID=1871086 RepID=UPI0039189CED
MLTRAAENEAFVRRAQAWLGVTVDGHAGPVTNRAFAEKIMPPAPSAPVSPERPASGFVLGSGSRAKLSGVHPRLIAVVERAIALTPQDFTVQDGVRTEAQQRALVQRGASKTMNSKHRVQADGYGHAVDLVPWVNGQPRWEWPLIWPIAAAMHQAARELNVALTWGGVWDRPFGDLDGSPEGLERAVAAYVARRRALGQSAFIDGPHYELRGA